MNPLLAFAASLVASLGLLPTDPKNDEVPLGETRVYRVAQTVVLDQIPQGAKQVRWWISIPDNERHQEVLDFSSIDVPGTWRIERDAVRGNRFLYVEVQDPKADKLQAVVEFSIRRLPVLYDVDPAKVGQITKLHRQLYAEEVAKDAPHMKVTPQIVRMADEVCGSDTNPATQAAKLLQHVANSADHYSLDASKPKRGIGDAEDCMTNEGGCCTDLHSMFIALSRARGIPARLQMGYRLNPKREGESYDPGYRCWVEYFLPNFGWMPADIVEADAAEGLGPRRWFTGLTEWRLWLNEGREFSLRPNQEGGPVNTMIIGHAEIDGRVARVLPEGELPAQLSRTVRYSQVR